MDLFSLIFDWEVRLMAWLQGFSCPFSDALAAVFTFLGQEYFIVGVIGFFFWCIDKEKGKRITLNVLSVLLTAPLLKNLVLRRRPYFDHAQIKCLKAPSPEAPITDIKAQGYSFPSMHAANSMAAFFSVASLQKKKWLWGISIALTLLVGVSRFYLGVHYPTDVLAGWLLAAVLLAVTGLLCRKIKNPVIWIGVLTVLVIPGWFFCSGNDFYTCHGVALGCVFGFLFEEKLVHFQNSHDPLQWVLRLAGAGLVFLGLNFLLKLPFSAEFLNKGDFLAHLVRFLRYAIILFVLIGPYTMAFGFYSKIKKR